MNKRLNFTPHIIALSALFVLGNGILFLPLKGAGEFTFLAFLISIPVLWLTFLIISFLWGKLSDARMSDSVFKRIIYALCLLATAVFSAFSSADTFKDIIEFSSVVMLPQTPKFYITVVFGLAVLYFLLKKTESVLKFSLISGVLVLGTVLFFFIASIDKYDLRNIFVFRLPTFSEILKEITSYLINPVSQIVILPVFLGFFLKRSRSAAYGVVSGGVLLGLCVLSSVLLFSAKIGGELEFPFSSAVSTVTVGRLFTRLDGFAYFVYFVCSILKITVCLSVVKSVLKELRIITQRK